MLLDGYVRVSRVGGRGGESFISPQVQRERIDGYAALHGHRVVQVWEELDESGANARRPMLNAVIARIERGDIDGLIVSKLDRFARSLSDAVTAIQRIDKAGGKLISVEDQFDTSTPIGKFAQQMLLALAELEHARVRDNWRTAQQHAVNRGIHVTPRVPVGYRRESSSSRMEVDPVIGPLIAEAYRLRARGVGPSEIAKTLNGHGVKTSYGNETWTASTVGRLFSNRAYLGEARASKGVVASDAHEALVDPETWAAAQRKLARGHPHRPAKYLLSGMIRCANCRYTTTGQPHPTGRVLYACRGEASAGKCLEPAAVTGEVVEPWLVEQFFAQLRKPVADIAVRGTDVAVLREAVAAAEEELAAWRDDAAIVALGRDVYVDGLRARVERRDEAHQKLSLALAEHGVPDMPDAVALEAVWPSLTLAEQRAFLAAAIDCVMLRRGRTGISRRAQILWRGEAPDDLPRRGIVTPFRTFVVMADRDDAAGVAGLDE